MLQTNLQEANLGISVYIDADNADKDRPLMKLLAKEAKLMGNRGWHGCLEEIKECF